MGGETVRLFTREMAARDDNVAETVDVHKRLLLMGKTWLKGSGRVCGLAKGPPRYLVVVWSCGGFGCQTRDVPQNLVEIWIG